MPSGQEFVKAFEAYDLPAISFKCIMFVFFKFVVSSKIPSDDPADEHE